MNKLLTQDKIRKFVKRYFTAHHRPELRFHTYSRAKSVVKAAGKIAVQYELSREDNFVLLAAAWFYSTGYLINREEPQVASADLAEKFLSLKAIDRDQIGRILATIMAQFQTEDITDIEDLLIRILLDARFHYLGTRSFLKKNELQRLEQQWLYGNNISVMEWLSRSYKWVEDYKFYTISALEKSRKGVDRNLKRLMQEFVEWTIIDEERSIITEN